MTARNGPGEDSNAGPVAGDRRTADKRSGQLESTARTDIPSPRRTDEDVRHLYVTPALVMAGSGRARWLLLYACPFCGGAQHVAHARLLTDVVRRRASCGHGWLLLHPIATTGKRSA